MSVGSFIIRRLGAGAIAVFGVVVLVFLFIHAIPGDPVDAIAGPDATAKDRKDIEECLHLDLPITEQFGVFLRNIANGTLGHQCPQPDTKPTVMSRIVEVMPYTIALAAAAMLVAIVFALPLGIIAAVNRGTWIDTASAVFSLAGISMPVMWMGPLAILVFFIGLGWFPGPAEPDEPFAIVLPALVIGTHLMAMLSRMTRASMVETLREDYIRTAYAKGLHRRTVLFKHALRNSLLPVLTVAGLQFGSLLSGAIITEKVFARPGLGTLLVDGILERNYPVVQGTVLFVAVIYVSMNLLVDLAYGLIDPRIRYG